LACAYDEEDGAIVIIGTGCVAFVRKGGTVSQIGGGGYLIDDSFSGFDLGRECLNALLEAEDGRGEKTLLTSLFQQTTGENIKTNLKTVYQKGKPYIASFSKLVFQAFEQGDVIAERIIRDCVKRFEKVLHATCRLFGEEKCEITLFGGLTKKFEVIKSFLSEEIKNKCIFKYPQYPIVYGLLKGFIAQEDRRDFAENLKRGYEKIA
jgi:N-acetylglucosamine kinase-like BadF-type ATPase